MMDFAMIESSDFERNYKHSMPDWMREEHMENCSGFTSEYNRSFHGRKLLNLFKKAFVG